MLQDVEVRRRDGLVFFDDDVAGAEEAEAFAEGNVHVERDGSSGALGLGVHFLEIVRAESIVPDGRSGITGVARTGAIVLGEEFLANVKLFAHLLEAWRREGHRESTLARLRRRAHILQQELLACLDKEFRIFDGRVLQDAMAEIENVALAGKVTRRRRA